MTECARVSGGAAGRWRWGCGVIVGAVALEALVVGLWAAQRGVNADEGFYLMAAQHVAEGRRLYADVFFPQMPYLPWISAWLFQFFGASLQVGRVLAVLGAAASAGLLAGLTWKQTHHAATTAVVGFLYVFSALSVNSLAIGKPWALVNAFLIAAFALLWAEAGRRPVWAFAAGLAAGCAIGLRLAVAPVAAVLALLAWRRSAVACAAFAAGGLIASLPWLAVFFESPDEFWFCNVTFHGLRRELSGWGPVLLQKVGVLAKWVALPQHLLVWGLATAGFWLAPRQVWPAAACLGVLAAVYACATPTYLSYMAQFFPFALLVAVPAIRALTRRPALLGFGLLLYLLAAYPLVKPVAAGSPLAQKRALWQQPNVAAVAAYVERHTAPGERVLSWWEGYPVLSARAGFVGVGFWESNVAKKLDPAAARHYHVMRLDDVVELIRRRAPAAIVVGDGSWEEMRREIEAAYLPSRRIGQVQIYTRKPPG